MTNEKREAYEVVEEIDIGKDNTVVGQRWWVRETASDAEFVLAFNGPVDPDPDVKLRILEDLAAALNAARQRRHES